jgi:hypothetical protein
MGDNIEVGLKGTLLGNETEYNYNIKKNSMV